MIDDRVTQNRSPLENYFIKEGGCEPPQIGVIKEGYIELTPLEPIKRQKSFFCCLRTKKKQGQPRIVDAQLVAFISDQSSKDRSFKLRFHSLRPGFNRKLEIELDLSDKKQSIVLTEPSKERNHKRELVIQKLPVILDQF